MFSIGSKRWPGISKIVEEIGELGQICGKLMGARGEIVHWDGSNLKLRLQEEIADVMAACDFVIEFCGLDQRAIAQRRLRKCELFVRWHETNPEAA